MLIKNIRAKLLTKEFLQKLWGDAITSRDLNNGYRPDVDGLRALAVLAVIFFHAFPASLPGGFVGVDVFFVISGYLISRILINEITSERFSYKVFMGKRIRRIFPSLCVVITFTICAGWLLLTADEYKSLSKQIIAGTLFLSNYLFWSEAGYFDKISEFKPLLHLWSLAIEEQYYLIWPIVLYTAFKHKKNIIFVCILIILSSFIHSYVLSLEDKSLAFFSLSSRFWELLVGSLLAIVEYKKYNYLDKFNKNKNLKNMLSIIGIILMLASFIITKNNNFPKAWPLLPVIGTVFFILSGAESIVNRYIFSNKIIVYIGLISYPLYLWHWPIISFEYILAAGKPSKSYLLIAILISFLLAIITNSQIEKRLKNLNISKSYLFLIPILIILSLFGLLINLNDGFPNRATISTKKIGDVGHEEFHAYAEKLYFKCLNNEILTKSERWGKYTRCHQSKKVNNVEVAIIGDSHAEHLFFGIANSLPQKNVAYLIRGGKPFVSNEDFKHIFNYIENEKTIRHVILSAHWYGRLDNKSLDLLNLETTIKELSKSGKKIVITDDLHTFTFDPSICKYERLISLRKNQCEELNEKWSEHRSVFKNFLIAMQKKYDIKVLFTSESLKNKNGKYVMSLDQKLLYRDMHHLNINGSKLIGNWVVKEVPDLLD